MKSSEEVHLSSELFLLLHRFSSSDYAELTEHSCFTDYARNLNGFGLTAIELAHSHSCFRGYRHDRQVEFPFKIREYSEESG